MVFTPHWHLLEEFGPDGTPDGASNTTVCYNEQAAIQTFYASILEAIGRGFRVNLDDYYSDGLPFECWLDAPEGGSERGVVYRAWPAQVASEDLYYCVSAGFADEADLAAQREDWNRAADRELNVSFSMAYGDPRLGKTDPMGATPSTPTWNWATELETSLTAPRAHATDGQTVTVLGEQIDDDPDGDGRAARSYQERCDREEASEKLEWLALCEHERKHAEAARRGAFLRRIDLVE